MAKLAREQRENNGARSFSYTTYLELTQLKQHFITDTVPCGTKKYLAEYFYFKNKFSHTLHKSRRRKTRWTADFPYSQTNKREILIFRLFHEVKIKGSPFTYDSTAFSRWSMRWENCSVGNYVSFSSVFVPTTTVVEIAKVEETSSFVLVVLFTARRIRRSRFSFGLTFTAAKSKTNKSQSHHLPLDFGVQFSLVPSTVVFGVSDQINYKFSKDFSYFHSWISNKLLHSLSRPFDVFNKNLVLRSRATY